MLKLDISDMSGIDETCDRLVATTARRKLPKYLPQSHEKQDV